MRSLRSGCVITVLVIGAIVMLPVPGHGQESTMSGTITDADSKDPPDCSLKNCAP